MAGGVCRKFTVHCSDEVWRKEKIVKPEPEIYRRLIERYALDSAACVFLDDSPANCQGAEAFGIRTILVQDRAAARRELRELLA